METWVRRYEAHVGTRLVDVRRFVNFLRGGMRRKRVLDVFFDSSSSEDDEDDQGAPGLPKKKARIPPLHSIEEVPLLSDLVKRYFENNGQRFELIPQHENFRNYVYDCFLVDIFFGSYSVRLYTRYSYPLEDKCSQFMKAWRCLSTSTLHDDTLHRIASDLFAVFDTIRREHGYVRKLYSDLYKEYKKEVDAIEPQYGHDLTVFKEASRHIVLMLSVVCPKTKTFRRNSFLYDILANICKFAPTIRRPQFANFFNTLMIERRNPISLDVVHVTDPRLEQFRETNIHDFISCETTTIAEHILEPDRENGIYVIHIDSESQIQTTTFVSFDAIKMGQVFFECISESLNASSLFLDCPLVYIDFTWKALIVRPEWWSPFKTNNEQLDAEYDASIEQYWQTIGLNNSIWQLDKDFGSHTVARKTSFDVLMGGSMVSANHCQPNNPPENLYVLTPFRFPNQDGGAADLFDSSSEDESPGHSSNNPIDLSTT